MSGMTMRLLPFAACRPCMRLLPLLLLFVLLAGCRRAAPPVVSVPAPPVRPALLLPPPLPDSAGWGVPVRAIAQGPDSVIWLGTHGHGLLAVAPADSVWRSVRPPIPGDAAIVAVAAGPGQVWYGTAGHGFGVSLDGGSTWRAWPDGVPDAGGGWVALNGITVSGDTVAIATSEGLRVSADRGESWLCVTGVAPGGGAAAGEGAGAGAGCDTTHAVLGNPYLLSLAVGADGSVWAGHLGGLAVSRDGGRSWREFGEPEGLPTVAIRSLAVDGPTVWAATSSQLYRSVGAARVERFELSQLRILGYVGQVGVPGSIRSLVAAPRGMWPAIASTAGLLAPSPDGVGDYRVYVATARGAQDVWSAFWWTPPYSPFAATSTGLDSYLREHPLRQGLATIDCQPREAAQADGSIRVTCDRQAPPRAAPSVSRHPLLERPVEGGGGNPHESAITPPGSAAAGSALVFPNPPGTAVRAVGAGVLEPHAGGVRLRLE
jgi:hypothetical protein